VVELPVLTHLDMIFDRTPSYVGSTTSWERYHATTLAALASADELGFLSRHTANDAASDGVLELDRGAVVHLGVDHLDGSDAVELSSPPLGGRPYLLVVGNAYRHKNRLFALRLLKWLVERHAWDGGLVLSGQHPDIGSSREAEDAFLRRESGLAGRVVDLGHVSAAERNGLYRGAELVLFPSLYEGFGFIPFEAAAFGRACAYSFRASMRELLPQEGALPSFDLDEAGPFVLDLLESATARERVVAGVRAAATRLTWDRTAAGYLELYARAVERPPRGISRELLSSASIGGAGRMSEREARVLDIYRRRRGFRLAVDATIQTTAAALRVARRDGEP
jgi:glycosyltransferase involved in cell wall biosynthesis